MNLSQVTKIAFSRQSQFTKNEIPFLESEVIYKSGAEAQNILDANKQGSDYLLVLNRYWDSYFGCYIEDRAWVESVSTVDKGQVAVTTGKSHTVCTSKVPSCDEINEVAKSISDFDHLINIWSKYREFTIGYFGNEKHGDWAYEQYEEAHYRLDNYKKTVENYRNWMKQVAPK